MSDIVEPDGELWTWVVRNGGQAKDDLWPPDSETDARVLGEGWRDSAKVVRDAIQLSGSAAGELRKTWPDAAGFEMYYAVHSLNNGALGQPGIEVLASAMDALEAGCKDYSGKIVHAKNAIRSHISRNNRLFSRCTSWSAKSVFAISVAKQIAKLMTGFAEEVGHWPGDPVEPPSKPKPHGFWGNVGEFFVGIGEGAVDMVKGFSGLIGLGEGGFSWSNLGQAWGGLGKFTLAAATYGVPGLSQLDQTVGLPGFERGEMARTLVDAGKVMVAWDDWDDDPARAAGKATFNIGSAVLGTKGAGAAIRSAGAAAAGSKIGAVANAGRIVERAGAAVTKIPTATEVAAKVVKRIPGVDNLLSRAGLGHGPREVAPHTDEPSATPHKSTDVPAERPPAHPPEDPPPPPSKPPTRPPEHVPTRPAPHTPTRPIEPSPTRPVEHAPNPHAEPAPSPKPGSVGEAMGKEAHQPSAKEPPAGGRDHQIHEENKPPSHQEQPKQHDPVKEPSQRPEAAGQHTPSRHQEQPGAAGHAAREPGQVTAHINPETKGIHLSDEIPPERMRESTERDPEFVRKAQEEWATKNPVQPKTRTQTVMYTVARALGLIHVGVDAFEGHHLIPSSEPPLPHPTRETPPKGREKTSPDEEPAEKAPLKPGDPGLPPVHNPGNTVVHLDPEAGKPPHVEPPEPPPAPKPEPTPSGPGAAAHAPEARPESRTPEARPENRAPDPRPGRRPVAPDLWGDSPRPVPRRPGSRLPLPDQWLDRGPARDRPMRGGEHPQRQDPPSPRTPEPANIHDAINPEPAQHTAPHEGTNHHDPATPHRPEPQHDLNPQLQTAWHEPRYDHVEPRQLDGHDSLAGGGHQLDPSTRYDVHDGDGNLRSRVYTDEHGRVTHVDAKAPNKPHEVNPEIARPAKNADYRVEAGHRVDSFHTDLLGSARTVTTKGVTTVHGKCDVTHNALIDKPLKPAKTVEVLPDHPLSPHARERFAARTDLEPDTRYHVTDAEGHPRGSFQTDKTGRVRWVDTAEHPGRLNPELRHRLDGANYRIDRGPMHQEYHVDQHGIPEPGARYERPETSGPPVHHDREVRQSEAFNRKHVDEFGNPKLDEAGNPTLKPNAEHRVTDEYGQPRATHFTDENGRVTHVEAETGQRGRTNAEVKHGEKIGADVTQDGFYGTDRAKNPEHTWPRPDNEVTYNHKKGAFGGDTDGWTPRQREQVTGHVTGNQAAPFVNRGDLPPNTRIHVVDEKGQPFGTYQTGPGGTVTHVHTGKPLDADLNRPPASAVVRVDDGAAVHRTDSRGNTVVTSGPPDPRGARQTLPDGTVQSRTELRRDWAAQTEVGGLGGKEGGTNVYDGGHHRGSARGGGGEAINQGGQYRPQNQGKATPLTPRDESFFVNERAQDKAGNVTWEDVFELRDPGADVAHSRQLRWHEVDENGHTTIHVRSFPNDHNVELWPPGFRG